MSCRLMGDADWQYVVSLIQFLLAGWLACLLVCLPAHWLRGRYQLEYRLRRRRRRDEAAGESCRKLDDDVDAGAAAAGETHVDVTTPPTPSTPATPRRTYARKHPKLHVGLARCAARPLPCNALLCSALLSPALTCPTQPRRLDLRPSFPSATPTSRAQVDWLRRRWRGGRGGRSADARVGGVAGAVAVVDGVVVRAAVVARVCGRRGGPGLVVEGADLGLGLRVFEKDVSWFFL